MHTEHLNVSDLKLHIHIDGCVIRGIRLCFFVLWVNKNERARTDTVKCYAHKMFTREIPQCTEVAVLALFHQAELTLIVLVIFLGQISI